MKFKKIISTICAFSMVVSSIFCCKAEGYEIKVTVFGDAKVGKTQILNRWFNDKFSGEYKPAVGAESCAKSIDSVTPPLKINICDTSGDKHSWSLLPKFSRDSDIGVCVVDLNNDVSLDIVEKVKLFRRHAKKNAEIILVGNKVDLIKDGVQPDFGQLEKAAKQSNIRLGCIVLVSAKEGKGIQELETKILDMLTLQEIKKIINEQTEKEKRKKIAKYCAYGAGIGSGLVFLSFCMYINFLIITTQKSEQVKENI